MIEAVNSVLSNASSLRPATEAQNTTRVQSANPQKVQEAAKSAPYISPYISIDRQSNRAVLQIRDSDTGDVVRQFPTEGQLKAYQQAQKTSVQSENFEVRAETSERSETQSIAEASQPSVQVASVETEA